VSRLFNCYAKCHYAECRYAEGRYAEYRYAEYHYAECRGALCTLYTSLEIELWYDNRLMNLRFLGSNPVDAVSRARMLYKFYDLY
jgi:hypothetical protein